MWTPLTEKESDAFKDAFAAEFENKRVQESIENDTKANKDLPQLPYSQRGPYFFRSSSDGVVHGFKHIGFLGSFRVIFDSDGTGKVSSSGFVSDGGTVYKEFSKFRAAQHKKMLEEFRQILSEGEDTQDSKTKAEQGGTDQPATAPEAKPEGSEKPKPESEGRSQ